MEEKIIDLRSLFVMNNYYFAKFLKEQCFDTLNAFLKAKSGVTHDPLFIREENGDVLIGYVPTDKKTTNFFSDESLNKFDDTLSRVSLIQSVIFEGCKAYGCYEDVPMAGAPERGDDAFFFFTHEGIPYKYLLWTKK